MANAVPLIPVYDLSEEEVIGSLDALPDELDVPVLILNDANQVLRARMRRLEQQKRAHLVYLSHQVGKAEAVRRGLVRILETDAEIVVQLDGDLKQAPSQAMALVSALESTGSELAIANRYAHQDLIVQRHRDAITLLMSSILRRLAGYEFRDCVCGMRAYSRRLADAFCRLRGYGYGLEIEQCIIAKLEGAAVTEVGIESNRQADSTPAEKFEENLSVLVAYTSDLQASDELRELLGNLMSQLKGRPSRFVVQGRPLGLEHAFVFRRVDRGSEADSYAVSLGPPQEPGIEA